MTTVAERLEYKFKHGARVPAGMSAQTVGERLEWLREQQGRLTADVVVEDAEQVHSPLHQAFEWDDTAAAHEYRRHQARVLIASVVVTVKQDKKEEPVRAFVVVTDTEGRRYTSTGDAMASDVLRRQVLESARRELKAFRTKYKSFRELSAVFEAINQVV